MKDQKEPIQVTRMQVVRNQNTSFQDDGASKPRNRRRRIGMIAKTQIFAGVVLFISLSGMLLLANQLISINQLVTSEKEAMRQEIQELQQTIERQNERLAWVSIARKLEHDSNNACVHARGMWCN